MGKGEITCYEQFLLFPQCFQKACFPGASKGVIVWEWVNHMKKNLDRVNSNATSLMGCVFDRLENISTLPLMF